MRAIPRDGGVMAGATTVVAAVLVIAAVAVALALAGFEAPTALGALWAGALGSWEALLSGTLVRSVPLILAGLAVTLAFRAGVWNIGAEGQLLAGAAAATAVALASSGVPRVVTLVLAFIIAVIAGGAWGAIAAGLRARFGVNEVISTIMLNFLALHIVGWLVRGPLQEPLGIYPQSLMIEAAGRLPVLIPGTRLHVGFALAIAAAVGMWWFLRATAAGFRIRAVGENARAVAIAGRVPVARTAAVALIASGAIAGAAGMVEVTGVTFALYENLSPGYGFTAIAIALMARLHPLGVVATGILFGALRSGAIAMQRDAGVPAVVVSLVEGLLVLLVLVAMYRGGTLALPGRRWRARAPVTAP